MQTQDDVAGGRATSAPRGETPSLAWSVVSVQLRRQHLRLTPQRRFVVAVLSEFEGHVTAAELVERCLQKDPTFVPSTVYRTLDLLENLGVITHIHNAEGHEAFQPATDAPHAHLICRACGATSEISADELGDLLGLLRRRHGFNADLSHLAIFGRCANCSQP
ncbi:MAG: Fur family transcriptional regulator [Candidatus Limnocylindrales bacterium]